MAQVARQSAKEDRLKPARRGRSKSDTAVREKEPSGGAKPTSAPVAAVEAAPAQPAATRPSRWLELEAALDRHRGETLLILLTGYPDPDSIGSALALRFLAQRFDIKSTLLAFKEVSHVENRALVKLLEVDLTLYEEGFDLSPYTLYAYVDTQRPECPIQEKLADRTFLAFVDHHKRCGQITAEFVDIREEAGSTCGIFAEYLRDALGRPLDSDDLEHTRLATAMMHGIRTDTRQFLEASTYDFEGAAYLWPTVDKELLRKISAKQLSPAVLDMIQAALERKRIYENFLFSDVGFVREEHRDGIPQTAEFLLSREGTDTVLVFGIVEGKTIDGSLRTTSDMINPDAFLKKAFGIDDQKGLHYGGGNVRDKGAFQIPIGFLAQAQGREQLYRLAWEAVHEKFLEAIGMKEAKS